MIFILSGPSGSGKTTLRDLLLKDRAFKKIFVKSVSVTTRGKRAREVEGKDYFFVSKKAFSILREKRRILEWTEYLGYYYGTKKDTVTESLKNGKSIILCLDFKGAKRVKKLYPKETVTIFVFPPSIGELRKRIQGRSCGTKKEEVLRRIERAKAELRNAPRYDYIVRNESLTQALKKLKGIVLRKAKALKSSEV